VHVEFACQTLDRLVLLVCSLFCLLCIFLQVELNFPRVHSRMLHLKVSTASFAAAWYCSFFAEMAPTEIVGNVFVFGSPLLNNTSCSLALRGCCCAASSCSCRALQQRERAHSVRLGQAVCAGSRRLSEAHLWRLAAALRQRRPPQAVRLVVSHQRQRVLVASRALAALRCPRALRATLRPLAQRLSPRPRRGLCLGAALRARPAPAPRPSLGPSRVLLRARRPVRAVPAPPRRARARPRAAAALRRRLCWRLLLSSGSSGRPRTAR
jgi:hypothetical protein